MRDTMKSPLFGIFIEEFKNSSLEIIVDLKLKSRNYANEIDFPTFLGLITSLFTEVLRANTKLLCCNIEFTSNDGNTKKYASDSDFILIENGQMNLDYNSLFIEIFGDDFERIPHLEDAKKLLQFIFKYSNTSLPGIATSATDYIFNLIIAAKSNNDSLKDLWRKLMCFMIKTVKMRKTKLTTYGGCICPYLP
jgi:hypothetical protein